MEIFVDFGLFEILAALGLAALARTVYSRRLAGLAFLVLSVAAPAALIAVASETRQRWLAALCLGTAVVNAALIFAALRSGQLTQPGDSRGQDSARRASLLTAKNLSETDLKQARNLFGSKF